MMRHKGKAGWVLVVAGLMMALGGCAGREPVKQAGYFGPTKTLKEVIEEINANNQKISSLWARFSYEATLKDPETGKERYLLELDSGRLQYRAPGEFRLIASKAAAGVVLDMGINKEKYWLAAPEPGPDTLWWGMVNSEAPINGRIPIPPQAMLEVLGVATLNTDLSAMPAPVLRFNNDARVYMIVWVKAYHGRYVATREAWYQMETLEPVKVLMFDEDGRVILRADLSKPKAMDERRAGGPKIATHYSLFFPESGSKMVLDLTKVAYKNGDAPNDKSFRFVTTPVSKEIRVDETK